eukprot:GHVS01003189.1.p1 GENE.GHVS01003189.1~~GHVS01003189.1.p1  ORF type:complete len:453 (+),score=101.76 GHVS01003189.1:333-1691(+)
MNFVHSLLSPPPSPPPLIRRCGRFIRRHCSSLLLLSSAGISLYLISCLRRKFQTGNNCGEELGEEELRNLLVQLGIGCSEEWKTTIQFCRNQKLSDITASQRFHSVVHPQLLGLHDVDYFLVQLRDNPAGLTPVERESYFKGLQLLTFSRFVVVVVAAALNLLIHRVQINFIGRQLFAQKGGGEQLELNYAYLSSTQAFVGRLQVLAKAVDTNVGEALSGVMPESVFTMDRLQGMISWMSMKVVEELYKPDPTRGDSLQIVSVMLPEKEQTSSSCVHCFDDSSLSVTGVAIVNRYLDVTRDYLESPSFKSALTSTVQSFTHLSMLFVAEKVSPSWCPHVCTQPRSWTHELADVCVGEFVLARCLGRVCRLSCEGGSTEWMQEFAEGEEVQALSRAVHFGEVVDLLGAGTDQSVCHEGVLVDTIRLVSGVEEVLDKLDYGLEDYENEISRRDH